MDGVIHGIWNTTVRGNSLSSTPGLGVGQYPSDETPGNACDSTVSTKYTNFGTCWSTIVQITCGVNTGFYTELQRGASLVIGMRICTGNNLPGRDPMTVSLEGSNLSGTALTLGSSWTPIYYGPSGFATDPGRYTCGPMLVVNNTSFYTSYRFLVLAIRYAESSTQYSELQLYGY